ncbi:MAG: pirin family protein [archaeon]
MIEVVPHSSLYHSALSWLKSWHHFSFGEYVDEKNTNWSSLRVFNEDIIAPRSGFPFHPHADMEIITYVLSGELTHTDSLGNKGVLRPGMIQRMSAGTGIIHSEENASPLPLHLFQMWVLPEKRGMPPSWEEKTLPRGKSGVFIRRAGPNPGRGEVVIHQRAGFYTLELDAGKTARFTPSYAHQYLVLASGSGWVGKNKIGPGDAVRVRGEHSLSVRADTPLHGVLWDLDLG